MNRLKTINDVCKMLDMTSRTIRYYEQLGVIQTVRESKTAPCRLDEENIEQLRKIRFLRKLGLALDEIAEIIDSDEKATEFIKLKKVAMKAEINELILRVNLLTEVIAATEQGENIYATEQRLSLPPDHEEMRPLQVNAPDCFWNAALRNCMIIWMKICGRCPPIFLRPAGMFISSLAENFYPLVNRASSKILSSTGCILKNRILRF